MTGSRTPTRKPQCRERVLSSPDRRPAAVGLDELGEHEQVGRVLRAHDRGQPLRDEPRQHRCPQGAVESSEPPAAGLAADDDQRPAAGKDAAKLPERAVPADVDDHVVAVCSVGNAGARVVDHVVRADGPDQVHLRGAAYAGDFGAVGLGDLHGERPDAARCADLILDGLDRALEMIQRQSTAPMDH
jgi:hypothetical protein